MNVGQLIDKLKKMPQELEVYDSSWEVVKDACIATLNDLDEDICTATLNDLDKEIVIII